MLGRKALIITSLILLLVSASTSSVFSTSSQTDWNQGTFNGTSADRKNSSGDLGIGYLNRSAGDDLVGYWRLDSSSSIDYSGNNRDGSINGDPVQGKDGIFGTSTFSFDGDDDSVSLGDLDLVTDDSNDEYTMSAWIKTSSSVDNYDGIVQASTYNGLFTCSDGGWSVQSNGDNAGTCASGTVIDDGKWHHVVGIYIEGKRYLGYEEGQEVFNVSTSNTEGSNSESGLIANRVGQNDYFPGKIDEVRIYNRSLSQQEVESLYFQGVNGKFGGNYTAEEIDNGQETSWDNLTVNASVPSDTQLTAKFKALETDGNVVDSEYIDIVDHPDPKNYSLTVSNSEDARVVFNGTSTNASKTWEINEFKTYYTSASTDTTPPEITIHEPANSTISDSTPWLNVTADEAIDTWKYNVDSGSNNTFTPNTTLSSLSDGQHNVTVWANDSAGNWNSTTRYFTISTGGTTDKVQAYTDNFKVPSSPGTKSVTGVGFEPDLIEFRVTSTNEQFNTTSTYSNTDGTQDDFGWGHGFAHCSGGSCEEIAMTDGSGSDSTNGYAAASSDQYSIFQIVTDPQGDGLEGFINGSVASTSSNGFDVQFDETTEPQNVVFTAYKFDQADISVGSFKTKSSTGIQSIDTGFQPEYLQVVSSPELNSVNQTINTGGGGTEHGWTFGWAANRSSDPLEQLTMSTTLYSNNIDSHVWAANDSEIMHTLWKQDSGDINGRLQASLNEFNTNGFDLDYRNVNPDTTEGSQFLTMYAAVNSSAYPDIGWDLTPTSATKQTEPTDVALDHVSFMGSNTISGQDVEGFSGNNNNDNHWGFMFGGGDGTRANQRSIGFSSHSNSVNGHASTSSNRSAFRLLYTDANGNIIGEDKAHINTLNDYNFTLQWDQVTTSSTNEVRNDYALYSYYGWGESDPIVPDDTKPNITIHAPANTTLASSSVSLDVTSNETSDNWKYNLDGTSNTTFVPNTTITGLSEGDHKITVYTEDSAGNIGKEVRYFSVDTNSPEYRDSKDNVTGSGFFETGEIANVNGYTKINFRNPYSNPVVVATGQEGADISMDVEASRPILKNITGDSFWVKVANDSSMTVTEDVGYMVMEDGHHAYQGVEMEAGTYSVTAAPVDGSGDVQTVSYQESFPSNTAVTDSLQSSCGPVSSRTGTDTLGSSSFDVGWEDFNSTFESNWSCSGAQAGYIAVERGSKPSNFESGVINECNADPDNNNWCGASFTNSYSSQPILFTNPLDIDGSDTAVVGRKSLSTTGVDLRPTENRIADSEQAHADNDIPWMVFSEVGGYTRNISSGETVNMSTIWQDTGIGLNQVYLATNETGNWQNKTSYGSPISYGEVSDEWKLSEFTWRNNSLSDTRVCWKQWAEDAVNKWESTAKHCFDIKSSTDSSPPTTSDNWTVSEWQSQSSAFIELTASDSESSVDSISYRLNGGSWTTVSGSSTTLTISSNGNNTLEYNATDSNGNTESVNTEYVALDDETPSTSDNYTASGWQSKSQTTLKLTCSDSHSGCGDTSYRVDGSSWTTEAPPVTFTVSGDGNHTVEYNSTDTAGSTESTQTQYVALDSSSPTISYNPTTTDSGTIGQDWIFINISASDSASGLNSVTEEFDGGNSSFVNSGNGWYWENHTGLSDGSYTIKGWAEDGAGNTGATAERTITVDTLKPPPDVTLESPADTATESNPVFFNFTPKCYGSGGCSNASLYLNASITGSTNLFKSSTQSDWNQGTFNGTSADRKDNSGDLGIGYLNGSAGDDLVAYWRLDGGNAKDYSGEGNDGTTEGSLTTGSKGILSTDSFSHDGDDDKISSSFTVGNAGNSFTVSGWLKSPDPSLSGSNWAFLTNYPGSEGNDGFWMIGTDDTSSGMFFWMRNQDESVTQKTSTYDVFDGSWHHLTAIRDADSDDMLFYIDGQLKENLTFSGDKAVTDSSGGSEFSVMEHYDRFLPGKTDEIKVYNRSLSESEVKDLYFNGKPFQGNYTAEKIDNSEETSWDNLEVNASIPSDTSVNATFKALDADGNVVDSEYIDIVDHPDPKNYSLNVQDSKGAEVVFNGTSTNATRTWEISEFKTYYSEAGGTGSGWEAYNTTNDVVNNTENSILFNFSENFTLPTINEWNIKVGQSNGNISFATNNRTVTVGATSTDYIESVGNQLAHSSSLDKSGGLTGAAFQKPSFSTGLEDTGSRTVGLVQSVTGTTDATGIWEILSTVSQITQLDQSNANNISSHFFQKQDINVNKIENRTYAVTTQFDFNKGVFDGASADRKDNSGTLGLGYLNGTNSGQSSDTGLNNGSLVGYWRLDRAVSGNGGTVKDYSGEERSGTAKKGVFTGEKGVFSTNATSYNGSGGYVVAPYSGSPSTFTVSAWAKLDSLSDDWAIVGSDSTGFELPFLIWYDVGNNRFQGTINVNIDGQSATVGGVQPSTNKFYHLTLTRNSTGKLKLYVNGDLIDEANAPDPPADFNGIYIGKDGESSVYKKMNGTIDEVRIYNRSLSNSVVKQLYFNTSADKYFEGNYTSKKIDTGGEQSWNKLYVDSTVPGDTNASAVFRALDTGGSVVDKQIIDLDTEAVNHSLSVSDSEDAEIVFNGTTTNATKTWEVNEFKTYYRSLGDGGLNIKFQPYDIGTGSISLRDTLGTNASFLTGATTKTSTSTETKTTATFTEIATEVLSLSLKTSADKGLIETFAQQVLNYQNTATAEADYNTTNSQKISTPVSALGTFTGLESLTQALGLTTANNEKFKPNDTAQENIRPESSTAENITVNEAEIQKATLTDKSSSTATFSDLATETVSLTLTSSSEKDLIEVFVQQVMTAQTSVGSTNTFTEQSSQTLKVTEDTLNLITAQFFKKQKINANKIDNQTYTVETQDEFNDGAFNGTSVDRRDNSGELGIGYSNGSNSNEIYDQMQLYYRFDQEVPDNGGNVKDYSGNGFDGTYQSVQPGQEGVFGTNSTYEDGSGDYLVADVPDGGLGIADSQSVTVSMWAKGDGQPLKDTSFAGHDANGNSRQIWAHTPWSDGNIYWDTTETFDGDGSRVDGSPSSPNWNQWNHYLFVHNSNTGRKEIWFNGVRIASSSSETQTFEEIIELYIFSSSGDGSRSYSGNIDDFMIWNRSLSESEIDQIHFNGLNGVYNGTYTSEKIDTSSTQSWDQLYVDSTVSTDTNASAVFRALDSSGSVIDKQIIDLSTEAVNHTLSVSDSEDAEIVFNGTSTNATKTWEVNEFKTYYSSGSGGGLNVDFKPFDAGTGSIGIEDAIGTNASFLTGAATTTPTSTEANVNTKFTESATEALSIALKTSGQKGLIETFAQQVLNYQNTATAEGDYDTTKTQPITASSSALETFTGFESLKQALGFTAENNEKFKPDDSVEENIQSGSSTAENMTVNEAETQKATLTDKSSSKVTFSELAEQAVSLTSLTSADKGLIEAFAQQLVNVNTQSSSNVSLRTSETQSIQSSTSLSAEFDVVKFLEQQLGISSTENEIFDANEELSENVQVNGSTGDNISAVENPRLSSQVGAQPEENISIVDRITGGFTASNSVTEIFKPRESTQVAVSTIEETRISPTFRSLVENNVETTMSAGLTWAANPTVSQSISYSSGTSVANNIYEVFLEDVLSVNTETGQTAGYNTSVNNEISSSQTVVETFKPVEIAINSVIATDAYNAVFKPEANLEQKIESGDAQNINLSFIDPAKITVNSETTKNPVFKPVQNLGQSILVEDQKAGTFIVSQVLEQGLDYSLSSESDPTFISEIGQSINSNAFSGSTASFDSYLNSAIVVSETELDNYSVKQGRKQNLDLIASKDSGFGVFELSENDLVVNTGTSSNISFAETLYESVNSPAVVDVTSFYSLSRANTVSVQTAAAETSERIFEALLSQSMVIQTAQNPNISYKSNQKQQITVSKSVEGVFARLIQLGQNYNVEERERSAFKPFSGINQFTSVDVAPDLNASYLTGTGQELILTNTQSSELAALDHLAQVVGQETRTNGDQIVLESAAQDIVTDTDNSASTLFSSTAFQTLDHQANPFSIQDLLAITTQPVVAQDGFDAGLLAQSNPKQQVDVGKSVQSIFNPSETAQQQNNLISETETNLTFIQELSETTTYSKQLRSTTTFLSMATSNIEIQNTFSQTSARIFEAFLEQTVDFQSSTRSQVEFNSSQNQGVNVGNTPTGAFTKMKSLTQGIDVGNELDPGFKPISNLDQSLALSTSSEQNASFVERNVAAIAAKSTQAPTLIATDLLYQNLQTNEDVEANIGITQTFDQGLEIGSNKKSTTTFADLAVQTTEFTSSTSTVQKLVVSAAQSLSNEETLSSETAALTAINQLIGTETGSETDFKPSVGIKDQITVDDITQNNLSFSEKVTGAVTYSNQIRSSANYLTTATSSTGAQTFASSTTQRILEAFVKQAVGINMDTNPDTDIKASSQSGIPVSNSITGFFAKNKIITQGINIEKNVNEIFKPLESTSQGISSENFVSQNISILEVASESVGVKSSSDSIFRLNIFAKQAVQTQTNPVPNTVFDLAADQVLGHGASTSESTSLMEALSELTGYQNLLSINAGFENRATQNISVSTSENADYSVLNTITQNTQLDNTIQNIFNPKANLNQTSRFETRQNTNIATLTAVSNSVSNTDMISSAAVFSTSSTSSFSFQNYAAYSSARIFEASLSQVIDAQDQSSSQASYRKLIENGLQITENINSVFETGFKLDQQTGFEQSIQEVFKPESKQEQQIEADNNMGQNASFLDVYTTNISVTTTQNSDLSLIRSIGENMGIITEESTGFNVSESSDQAVTAASTRTATPAWAAEAVQTLNLVAQSSNTIDLSLAVSQNVSAPTESDNLIDFAAANFQTVAIQTTDSTKLIWSIVRSQQIGLQKDALSMFNASEEVQQNLGTENSAQGILEGFDAVNQELKFEESPQGMFSAYTIQNNTLNVSSDQESSVSFNDLAIETISYSSRFYGFPGELFYVGVTQPIGIIDEGSENRQQEDSGSDEDAGSGGGSSGGSSGGGSGGGGGLSGDLFEDEPQGINVTPDNFTLRLDPDNTKERQVQVQNIGNEEIQVDGRVTSARRLISIPQYQKEIGPKETESFNVLIEPSDNVGPGVYDGSIDFESPYNTKNVEATIIVKNESADELLDVKLDMDSSEIISGESGAYKVDILNMGQSEKVDITLGKTVINTSSGERIYETTETLAVQTSASISRNIRKDTLTPGEYKLEIVAKYSNGNKTASTSTTFNVKENEQKSIWQSLPIAEYTVAALLVILATTALIYARKLYIKKKVEREVKEIKTEIKSQIEEGKIEDKHRIMLVLKQAEKSLDYSEYKHAYGKLEQIEEILE